MIKLDAATIDAYIQEYLDIADGLKHDKRRQDYIKDLLQEELIAREVTEIIAVTGTVNQIDVAKSVAYPAERVHDLATVWDESDDPIFQQCGRLLINLARPRPARSYLRITGPRKGR